MRKTLVNSTTKNPFWVLFMIIALVFAQGAYLHVHTHNSDLSTVSHIHDKSAVHTAFSVDQAHPDQDVIVDIELSKQGMVKNLTSAPTLLAVLAFFTLLLLPRYCIRISFRHEHHSPNIPWRNALVPLLRAPPR